MASTAVGIESIPITQSAVQNPPSYTQYVCTLDGTNDITLSVPANARWWIIGLMKSDSAAASITFKSGSTIIHEIDCVAGEKIGLPTGYQILCAGDVDDSLVISSDAATTFLLSVYMDHYPPLF